jgi:hypothetical protein
MGILNFFTRKKKKNTNLQNNYINYYPNVIPMPKHILGLPSKYTPRSPERQKFFKKFAEEIVSVWAPKPNNPVTRYVERNYETEASSYLRKLYLELNEKNEPNFINKKLREFRRNANNLSLSPRAKEIVESKLKSLRMYNQLLRNTNNNNNNNNTRRRRTSTRTRFSSNLSNTSISSFNSNSSLPSLQSLRNNTKNYEEERPTFSYTPRRRLQGKVISPKKQPLEEV